MDVVGADSTSEKFPAKITSGNLVPGSDAAAARLPPRTNMQPSGDSFSGGKRKQPNRSKFVDEADPSSTDIDPNEYEVRKFMPPSMPRRRNDVFITIKTCFEAQLKRCIRLLDEPRTNEISLHGIGQGVSRAVNLALRLEHHYYPAVQSDPRTETITVTDALFPLRDELDPMTRDRRLSAIHIRVFFAVPKSIPLPQEPKATQGGKGGPPHHITKDTQKAPNITDNQPLAQRKDQQPQHAISKVKADSAQRIILNAENDARPAGDETKLQPPNKDRKKLPPGVTASAPNVKKTK